jgi:hypothetical protein
VDLESASLKVDDQEDSLRVTWQGNELVQYVYRPSDPPMESPRPYFHPVRTLGGDVVSLYRPHDHVWHKGIAWSLSNVGEENFWGGVTYVRDQGYQQLPNNGAMVHESFEATGPDNVVEHLGWFTQTGRRVIDERRRFSVTVSPASGMWRLAFDTSMRNVSGATLTFGSPTTQGRDNAGYSGLFWRGPRAFGGGTVLMADARGRDELMGRRGPWLAYLGRHDEHGRTSTLLFAEDPGNPTYPNQWFVRTVPFACVCPAPFFSTVYPLPDGDVLSLRYTVAVADGALDAATCEQLIREENW